MRMTYDDLNSSEQISLSVVCAKALLTSFEVYLNSAKFQTRKEDEIAQLWQVFEALKAEEDVVCQRRMLTNFISKQPEKPESRAEKHSRIKFAREMDEAKRAYLNAFLNLESDGKRESQWAEIGKKLAEKHYFIKAFSRQPGRPKSGLDIDLMRANAFDAMKRFVRIAQGKDSVPFGVELEFEITETLPPRLRVSDKMLLAVYHALSEVKFVDDIKICLEIVEDNLRLEGAKSDSSLLNSISRGRTTRRAKTGFSLAKDHEQIFHKS